MIRRYVAALVVLICCFYTCLPLSAAQQTCCDELEGYDEISNWPIIINFYTVQLNESFWDLRANLSWTAVDGYVRYDVEFEPYSAPTGNSSDCNPSECTLQGNATNENVIVVDGLKFGFLYRLKVYFVKAGEVQRGPYASLTRDSPDCIYRTRNFAFCQEQAVQYAGQPFDIQDTNIKLHDDREHVTVLITWRQSANINPETPLNYYEFIWKGGSTEMQIALNISYESGGYVMTELNNLLVHTSYSLSITPIVIGEDGSNIRGRTGYGGIRTYFDIPPEEQEPHTVAIALIISAAVIFAVASILVFVWLMYKESHN